jgi:hypothetical protein
MTVRVILLTSIISARKYQFVATTNKTLSRILIAFAINELNISSLQQQTKHCPGL